MKVPVHRWILEVNEILKMIIFWYVELTKVSERFKKFMNSAFITSDMSECIMCPKIFVDMCCFLV